jgi:hypothetical protein
VGTNIEHMCVCIYTNMYLYTYIKKQMESECSEQTRIHLEFVFSPFRTNAIVIQFRGQ